MQEAIRVERDLSEIRQVRAWAAAMLEGSPVEPERREDALLMVSELVTNALRHTESAPDVCIHLHGAEVVFEISDDDPTPPVERGADASSLVPGGWGIHVVDRLADDWGVRPSPDGGKTVWFTVRAGGSEPS